jgi:hypothetical protein
VKGGYYIEANTDDLKEALRGVKGGLNDLRAAYREIAEWLKPDIARYVPIYGLQHSRAKDSSFAHDGRSHPPPGNLFRTLETGATINGPWARIGGHDATYAILQEFGGTSFWHGSGRGTLRASNRAHRSAEEAASRAGIKGHVIYKKPRAKYGYFIWNAGYRNRMRLGSSLYGAIRDVCAKHGLLLEVPANPALDIKPQARRAA